MFDLVKIVNGRINTSEPRYIGVTAIGSAIAPGTPVNISAGVVTPLTASTTVKATHLVLTETEKGATTLFVLDITPNMVFEAPLTAEAATEVNAMTEVKITADGVSVTAVSNSVRGALTYDKVPVSAKGTKVLVTFPIV